PPALQDHRCARCWGLPATFPRGQSHAPALTPKLERCRAKTEKNLDEVLSAFMRKQRVDMQATMDRLLLDAGFDVEVSVTGQNKDGIILRHISFGNRAVVHAMTNKTPFLDNPEKVVYKDVTCTDAFGKTTDWHLAAEREDNGGE